MTAVKILFQICSAENKPGKRTKQLIFQFSTTYAVRASGAMFCVQRRSQCDDLKRKKADNKR